MTKEEVVEVVHLTEAKEVEEGRLTEVVEEALREHEIEVVEEVEERWNAVKGVELVVHCLLKVVAGQDETKTVVMEEHCQSWEVKEAAGDHL